MEKTNRADYERNRQRFVGRLGMDAFFFDTYAIIEILKGNKNYDKYKNATAVITVFNLAELHYKILRDFNKELADEILEKYSKFSVNITLNVIKNANVLRKKYDKLSAPDAIGYATALEYGIKFLTGDSQFKDMENVEFMK